MEIEYQMNSSLYDKYNTHVDSIRSYLGELLNQTNEIREKKSQLSQKLKTQINILHFKFLL